MKVTNVNYYPNIPWEDYCKLPGKSFSWLKNEGKEIANTEGIHIGKLVHTYLLKPNEYNYEMPDVVIPIARELIKFYKEIVYVSQVEIGMTANFIYEGLIMPYKGMADMLIKKYIVVDFKVLAGDLDWYIKNYHYEEQLRGYMLPGQAPIGMIIAFNKKTKQPQLRVVDQNIGWWVYKIKQYGTVCQEYLKDIADKGSD